MKTDGDSGRAPFVERLRGELLAAATSDRHSSLPANHGRRRSRLVVGTSVVSAILLALLGIALLGPRGGLDPDSGSGSSTRFGIDLSHPLLNGLEVSKSRAAASCNCPSIGSMASQVSKTYTDGNGGLAYVLNDGTWIVMTTDARSMQEYVTDMQPVVDSGDLSSYDVMTIDGRQVIATDATPNGPAAILWVADGYRIEVLALGGASLDQLKGVAEQVT